ncbi:MAG: cytochrome c [Hyphomonadaceae bacterium]
MHKLFVIATLSLVAACAGRPEAPSRSEVEARGARLTQSQCGECHAIGATGESPAPEAPPFRTLSRNYRVANLQEALAEGISVGHPAMPQFEFAPEDVDAIIAYLESIQEPPTAAP